MNTFAFQVTLDSNILQIPDIKRFIGKEVIVTIVELPQYSTTAATITITATTD